MSVRTFLPWYRRGLPAGITAASARTDGRVAVPLTMALAERTEQAAIPVALAGPGDVGGLDQREIRRVHPYDGCASFEPGLFAHAELAAPDLPWRFTPFAPDADGHLRPWLVLVVVDSEHAELRGAVADGLPLLVCPSSELPDLEESWAWAHVQVTREPGQAIADVMRDMPERAVARLLCPRRLSSGRAYLACIVPAFAAALAQPPAGDPLANAWGEDGEAELPVYFHWRFSTGRPGSFETLVRALTPRAIPLAAATRRIGVADPGWGLRQLDPERPRASLPMYGLLRPVGAPDLPPADEPALQDGLREAIDQTHERPQVRPPLYGQDYVDRRAVPAPAEEPAWFRELNLDPRGRLIAGLGAMTVRVLQEDLVAEAWHQLARAHRPPDEQARGELADVLHSVIDDPSAGGSVLRSLRLVDTTVPALRRLARPGGSLARRSRALGGPAVAPAPPRLVRRERAEAASATPRQGFAPRFERPAYELLRSVHPEWVLPGLSELPPDSVTAVETSSDFVEAFLIGLNHELGRELTWRRYPVDRRGTFFASFWPAGADTEIGDWTTGALGDHVEQDASLVLLVRGELLRRFPQADLYALRQTAGAEPGTGTRIAPTFAARWGEDVTLIGFALTAAEAFADGSDLWFVIEEDVRGARFGCDEASSDPPAQPAHWQDLQWGNADFANLTHLPASARSPGSNSTSAPTRPSRHGGASTRRTWPSSPSNRRCAPCCRSRAGARRRR